MNKENVKKFWNKHNKTIKNVVMVAIIPVPAIILYYGLAKYLDKHVDELNDLLEYGNGIK